MITILPIIYIYIVSISEVATPDQLRSTNMISIPTPLSEYLRIESFGLDSSQDLASDMDTRHIGNMDKNKIYFTST